MRDHTFKPLRTQEVPQLAADGKLHTMIQVTYMLGEDGPFNETFNKEGFSAAAVKQKLQAFASEIGMLHS
jgi:hypothetical protein